MGECICRLTFVCIANGLIFASTSNAIYVFHSARRIDAQIARDHSRGIMFEKQTRNWFEVFFIFFFFFIKSRCSLATFWFVLDSFSGIHRPRSSLSGEFNEGLSKNKKSKKRKSKRRIWNRWKLKNIERRAGAGSIEFNHLLFGSFQGQRSTERQTFIKPLDPSIMISSSQPWFHLFTAEVKDRAPRNFSQIFDQSQHSISLCE